MNLPPRELRICNNWRLFFQALTLSDIVTPADGRFIQDRYWIVSVATNDRGHYHQKSKLNWPFQPAPDRSTFNYWKKCIKLAFNLRNRQQLPIPLGNWMISPQTSVNQWEYYLQPMTNVLYHNKFDGWYDVHNLEDDSTRFSSTLKFDSVPDEQIAELPSLTLPVTPSMEYNSLRLRHAQYLCPWQSLLSPVSSYPRSFDEHLTTLPTWKQQLLMHWEDRKSVV